MPEIVLEQALFRRRGEEPPQLLARSPGFLDEWRSEAEGLVTGFGERPPGRPCPAALFAYPLGKKHVAIVNVADQEANAQGQPAALGFRVLVVPRDAYARFLGDPFLVSDRLPPVWTAAASLPTLSLPAVPLPPRTVADVRRVLQRVKSGALQEDEDVSEEGDIERTIENSESPALLGGVQVLVDGGRLVFERPQPDAELVRGLWTLLPTSTRAQLWPASFAFGNTLEFDALVVPRARPAEYPGYTREEQAADYPEGRYELNLQIAAEAGDQRSLDALLSRRSVRETWKLVLTLVALVTILALVTNFFPGGQDQEAAEREQKLQEFRRDTAKVAVGLLSIHAPGCPLGHDPWSAALLFPQAQARYRELVNQFESQRQQP